MARPGEFAKRPTLTVSRLTNFIQKLTLGLPRNLDLGIDLGLSVTLRVLNFALVITLIYQISQTLPLGYKCLFHHKTSERTLIQTLTRDIDPRLNRQPDS